MHELNPRKAERSDLDRIKELEQSSNLAPWTLADYEIALESEFYLLLVAENEDVVNGFLLARIIPESSTPGLIEIMNIAVDKRMRRNGIGSSLVMACIESSTMSTGTVELEMRESNTVARTLYEKLGFTVQGRRSGYYSNPEEAAILMTLHF